MVSEVSVLTFTVLGEDFVGSRVVSRFRFREGITSSISRGSGESSSSFLTGTVLCENRERDVRLLRRGEDVALRSLEVSWEILEVRMVEVGRLQELMCG